MDQLIHKLEINKQLKNNRACSTNWTIDIRSYALFHVHLCAPDAIRMKKHSNLFLCVCMHFHIRRMQQMR